MAKFCKSQLYSGTCLFTCRRWILVLLFTPVWIGVGAQNQTDVLSKWQYYNGERNSLYHYLADQAFVLLENRKQDIEKIKSSAEWKERQQEIKKAFEKSVGPFPEKTPLNPEITRVVQKDGYRIENILFQSQPGFFVSSSLYIPDNLQGKMPAIIYCSGHNASGYRSRVYQHDIVNLVRKGFVVYAFDPVGQGERLAYTTPDPVCGRTIKGPTKEHSYPGTQAFILGSSQARTMIWDGIRAVDYLLTRKEIDPERIGITGRSGGGTQSAYIAAFDERIYAAAPENYITNFTRLLQTRGPQDAEQNFCHGIANDLDHADLLTVRAPKPALVITTYNDIFNFQGVKETVSEVSRAYEAFHREENFKLAEDIGVHESTRKNRETRYAFFQKFLNNPGSAEDIQVELPTNEDLKVTRTGQVPGKTVFDLNFALAEKYREQLDRNRKDLKGHLKNVIEKAQVLSGYSEPVKLGTNVFAGIDKKDSYSVVKYFLEKGDGYLIPYMLYKPDQANREAIIYLHPSGKAVDAYSAEEIKWLVQKGYLVLSPDLAGTGETAAHSFTGDAFLENTSFNIWYASILINKSIAGIRAEEIVRLAKVLESEYGIKSISAIAKGNTASVLLHAAALYKPINKIALINTLSSYQSVVGNRFYAPAFALNAVAGMLKFYDLPDLAATLAPRKLLIDGAVDGNEQKLDRDEIENNFWVAESAYKNYRAEDLFIIQDNDPTTDPEKIYAKWINNREK
ncbi:MAG: acetylxylan esterase [Prolixibacteraceae bacterium]